MQDKMQDLSLVIPTNILLCELETRLHNLVIILVQAVLMMDPPVCHVNEPDLSFVLSSFITRALNSVQHWHQLTHTNSTHHREHGRMSSNFLA